MTDNEDPFAEFEDAAAELEHDLAEREKVLAGRASIREAKPSDLVEMWKTFTHWQTGKKLTQHEWEALADRWFETFDKPPPGWDKKGKPKVQTDDEPAITATEPDTMLSMSEVCRITGLSESTVRRMYEETPSRFPLPIRLTDRRIGWPARDVHSWLEARDAKREAAYIAKMRAN